MFLMRVQFLIIAVGQHLSEEQVVVWPDGIELQFVFIILILIFNVLVEDKHARRQGANPYFFRYPFNSWVSVEMINSQYLRAFDEEGIVTFTLA